MGLIQRVKVNDQEAWQRLLDLYAPLIYSWCRRSGMQAEDAADVLQEVFRAVSRGISDFRHDRPGDTFRGWLRTIARNKIRDHFRRRAVRPIAAGGSDAAERFAQIADDESQASTESGPLGGMFHRALELIRAEFEDRTWQAFWMATVDQRPSADVARQLDMSPGAVRQAKYKVLRRLRQELGDAR
ncbi:MAG: RNA polymerase sigma factor [Planctomycetota bacterium]|jgi:RNA polymerase sigma-70 factor (ECF subfamily)